MRIIIVDTYYAQFLKNHYRKQVDLARAGADEQRRSLLNANFGTSDFYSHNLESLGCETLDLIANCIPLQRIWAQENNIPFPPLLHTPRRARYIPLLGPWLRSLTAMMDIAMAQIRAFKPDIVYCQDLSFFPEEVMREVKRETKLVVGQVASPLPAASFLRGYDLIITSFPHFVPRLRAMGIASEYLRIGFDERVLAKLGDTDKDIAASFVGGITPHHGNTLPLLEYLAKNTNIIFFGYGKCQLPFFSPIRKRHHGEVWGMDMYRALARSRITLNRHINVAENYANNMRLYEATGVGTMLVTDLKDNLGEIFEVGSEVVAYKSKEEAAELIRYYTEHPKEAAAIAAAGQARTLREHTYAKRMEQLVPILKRYLDMKLRS